MMLEALLIRITLLVESNTKAITKEYKIILLECILWHYTFEITLLYKNEKEKRKIKKNYRPLLDCLQIVSG